MKIHCLDCEFFDAEKYSHVFHAMMGQCRKHPTPTPKGGDGWCGEGKPKVVEAKAKTGE